MRVVLAQIIAILVILFLGFFGYKYYDQNHGAVYERVGALKTENSELRVVNEQLAEKNAVLANENSELESRNAELTLANTYLKVDMRVARIEVLRQEHNPDDAAKVLSTTLRFTEFYPDGGIRVPPREFTIEGDVVYVDTFVVKFQDKFVEQNGGLRNRSLLAFRRIFGENQKPADGFLIDAENSVPVVYQSGDKSPEAEKLESEIWADFWAISNDPERQEALGIRANHGEAPSQKLEPGNTYVIELRASGGPSFTVQNPVDH